MGEGPTQGAKQEAPGCRGRAPTLRRNELHKREQSNALLLMMPLRGWKVA